MSIDHIDTPTTANEMPAIVAPEVNSPEDPDKKNMSRGKKVGMIATATTGVLALAAGGYMWLKGGSDSNNNSPANHDPNPVTTEKPAPVVSGDYGPAGAEKEAFIDSLKMPATASSGDIANIIANGVNTMINVGQTKTMAETFMKDTVDPNKDVIDWSIEEFGTVYTGDWSDEYMTMFDTSSASSKEFATQIVAISAADCTGYLGTVNNESAKAVYSSTVSLVSFEEISQSPDGSRDIKITMNIKNNADQTGVIVGVDHSEFVFTKIFTLTKDGDNLIISAVVDAQ